MGRRSMVLAGAVAAMAIGLGGLVGCRPNYEVQRTEVTIQLPCNGGYEAEAMWFFPRQVTPTGFIWLQHGFARANDQVVDLGTAYAARGFVVLAPSIGPFGTCGINSATQHQAIATVLTDIANSSGALQTSAKAARTKLGLAAQPVPTSMVLSGHSAGGALVVSVGGRLASSPTAGVAGRLKGLVLLDPVENADNAMAANLPKLASKKVLTLSAPGGTCNSSASGTTALAAARSGFIGVRFPSGCHCDAEADTTDSLCTIACGTPKPANEAGLKLLAADWAQDMLAGTTSATAYPGGTDYEKLKAEGTIVTLTGSA